MSTGLLGAGVVQELPGQLRAPVLAAVLVEQDRPAGQRRRPAGDRRQLGTKISQHVAS